MTRRVLHLYDAEDRISQVDGTLGSCSTATACYTYDADGRRVEKTGGVTTDYIYDLGSHEIAQYTSAGGWTHGEVYAGSRHLAAYSGGASGMTYFVHADWLGNERIRTNASGTNSESCTNLPYGDGLNCSGADVSPMHFTGKEHDTETGLENFGARYDSSSIGRFMTPDWSGKPQSVPYATFGNPQSINLYIYLQNNPLGRTDPDGHNPCQALACQWLNVLEVKVTAGITAGVSGQLGTAKVDAHATLIGGEAKSGLAGGGAEAKLVGPSAGASLSAGPVKAGVDGKTEASTNGGPSASANASISAGPVQGSASASVDKNGPHASVSGSASTGGDTDSKLALGLKALVGVEVDVNLSQAGRAMDSTITSLQDLGTYIENKFVPDGAISDPLNTRTP